MDVNNYFRYWGKARQSDDTGPPCHLLPYHCLDVAATGQILLQGNRELTHRLARGLGVADDVLVRLFVYSLALHDLGKFARSFQGLARPEPDGCELVPPVADKIYERRHDALGHALWQKDLKDRFSSALIGEPDLDMELEDALELWLGCFFGHHGKPTEPPSAPLRADFLPDDIAAARAFAEDAEALLAPAWPDECLANAEWRERRLAPLTWQIAGLAILLDWLGSNADCFHYCAEPMPLADYWYRHALDGARQALAQTGFLDRPRATVFGGFTRTFRFAPTPLQAWAESVTPANGPQLFLLEDITGAGKTEAALTLAHRLMACEQGSGLYFGLPTMATSNAMYRRLGHYYRAFYPEDSHPSLVLAHSARHLDETFEASVVPEPNADRSYGANECSAGAECRTWLADNRKKALLAEVGVGTIDQALLGVLPRKHQALRLLGLADKVLVVDEIHAYDTYTTELLRRLLIDHARRGGSAILLSATIPQGLRGKLIAAWQQGRGSEDTAPVSAGFPLATHVHDGGLDESCLEAHPSSRRELPCQFIHDPDKALEVVVGAAREGRCACWVRNTVDDAIEAYRVVRERLTEPERAMLFHARFTMADRQRIEDETLTRFGKESTASTRGGRVLIATQVVEQSLDLDFDVLVSDLAPVDLLIQRAGRLHRHLRDQHGNPIATPGARDARPKPKLYVLTPEWTEAPGSQWVQHLLPGTAAVYPEWSRLWATARILRREGTIRLPERARTLVEAVYGEEAPVPEALSERHWEHWAWERVAQSTARFNALDLERGYRGAAAAAGWSDDQEIGTRLSDERTVRVVVVERAETGLQPRHGGSPHAWSMSTMNLRESLARRLPELPAELAEAAERLSRVHPELGGSRFWLASAGPDDETATYDRELGAVIPRGARNNPISR